MLGTDVGRALVREAVRAPRAPRTSNLARAREYNVGRGQAGGTPGCRGEVAVPEESVITPAANDVTQPPKPATELAGDMGGQPASPVLLVRQPKMDGARLLNQSFRFIGGLGVWPDDHSKVAASLYAASTHGKDPKTHLPVFPYRPRFFFTSDEGGSGKTRLNKATALICHDPVSLIESSKAGFIGMIRKYRTVIVTELDNWVGPTGRRNSWLLGIGNAGYEPGHVHTHKESGQEVEIDLFGDMMLDGLAKVIYNTGNNLTTFVSRAVIVWVRRAPEGYRAPRITKQVRAFADDGKMRLAAWMQQEIEDGLEDDEPDMSGLPGNRPGALWEPLIMVADRAGGEWPELAREACLHLESPAGKTATTLKAIEEADRKLDEWGF